MFFDMETLARGFLAVRSQPHMQSPVPGQAKTGAAILISKTAERRLATPAGAAIASGAVACCNGLSCISIRRLPA